MLSFRGFWSRHRRKVFAALGVFGSGYVIYKLYDAHRRRISDLEKQLEGERQVNELIRAQLQKHFESIQRISDTTTLPYAMHYLRSRILEELDLSHLTEKLMQGKAQSNAITSKEKLELWERLKVLSFTRTASSLWSVTMLCLYVRVQVNILGRHLYLEVSRGSEGSQLLDESDSFSRHGQQDFLATADYLSAHGIDTLIMNMQKAAMEVLKEKQLRDPFSMVQLRKTIIQILELFMSIGGPNCWMSYLIPENAIAYRQLMVTSTNDSFNLMDVGKLEQLMSETRSVLSSPDFGNIVEISLKKVVDMLVDDISTQLVGMSPPSGVPLAKLLPRVTQLCLPLLEEPSSNKFVQTIRGLPDVELFYTLLYANMCIQS
ncbi:peroxisome biogenesis protein 3-1-like [Phoenix dactylifera]|uniref:Peroxisome biogenesis protein 3-1-like n=1 Tax=Phoenix dactylifera TaxID=42345 RepID=A0A8B7CP35_PHODC|nr:peroxisome biogenesis protein 3-1-like [Phoenix dactylifera]